MTFITMSDTGSLQTRTGQEDVDIADAGRLAYLDGAQHALPAERQPCFCSEVPWRLLLLTGV